jgi:3-phosphoshikimate 1-carboxyvinyltransferase
MRIRIVPGSSLAGEVRVPGDKSIAHRWLLLAGTASGPSRLEGLPLSLDVRSTARCLAAIAPKVRPALDLWTKQALPTLEGGRSTWNASPLNGAALRVEVEGEGRRELTSPTSALDCGNSGTTMRLMAGVLAGVPLRAVLTGDESLSIRPMERVARPLREMGAEVTTTDGHAPVTIGGGGLSGIRFEAPVPSAQVKSAVLFAGTAADGITSVVETVPTRDHTERALAALGAPVTIGEAITIEGYQHRGFRARVPGDPSSAAFLIAAAALTHSGLVIQDVGLNPSRLHFLGVMARMGIHVETAVEREELGEPVGSMVVRPAGDIVPVHVETAEIPLVIDEVPILAVLAAHAAGESSFVGVEELRVKESDRVGALVTGIRGLGGQASDEGDKMVVAGGGLTGGSADPGGDHRMAMSFAVAGLAARGPCEVPGAEAADVSFPGFTRTLATLGAHIEAVG